MLKLLISKHGGKFKGYFMNNGTYLGKVVRNIGAETNGDFESFKEDLFNKAIDLDIKVKSIQNQKRFSESQQIPKEASGLNTRWELELRDLFDVEKGLTNALAATG